ncbi:hypothetical protein FZC76_14950 [Sutcliffiella horikoshii]|uniref:YcxB-like protein domain-containing protein n=1 Tax=Sutcliffiella horikoshii TaxID=79883 RepID=A0A5D4T032_9BACI|nr:hypothetical protein [Sutcliffiella horikoshii]TYS67852.1 hypothetical protein FZC76_14950 [Sutcliffiella horikoshii]
MRHIEFKYEVTRHALSALVDHFKPWRYGRILFYIGALLFSIYSFFDLLKMYGEVPTGIFAMSAVMAFLVPLVVAFLFIKVVTFVAGVILLRKPIYEDEMVVHYQDGDDFFLAGNAKFHFNDHSKMIETKDYYIFHRGKQFLDGIAIPKLSSLDEGYEERVEFLIKRVK